MACRLSRWVRSQCIGQGSLQCTVTALDAVGDGLWRKALEEATARLRADGLLEPSRKRALPRFPRRVAVITSPDGAALRDIIAVTRRRCPTVEIVLVPAKVQGDGAPADLARAIACVTRWGAVDTVIIGRGGGPREDLWAFNSEAVARALAACAIPTISAVGHEVDVTLCDLVADHRAATPSAAAEAAVPVLAEARAEAAALLLALREALVRQVQRRRDRVERVARDLRLGVARRRGAPERAGERDRGAAQRPQPAGHARARLRRRARRLRRDARQHLRLCARARLQSLVARRHRARDHPFCTPRAQRHGRAQMSYETDIARIETIVVELERSEVPLDDALRLFEEGIERLRAASAALMQAEARVRKLIEDSDGGFTLADFES